MAAGAWGLVAVLLLTLGVLLASHLRDRAGWPTVVVLGFLTVAGSWVVVSAIRSSRPLVGRLILVLLIGLGSLLAVDTAVMGRRYGVSFTEAARGVVRDGLLTGIEAAVAVHDPCPPRFAGTGPDLGPEPAGLVRIEELAGDRFTVESVHNETIVRCQHGFRYQPYDEPRLRELRRKYRLDDVVAGAAGEFEAQVLLRSWSRSRFRREDYQPIPTDFDALEVLDRDLHNLAGEPYQPGRHIDPCHFFPLLYAQVLLSMGHQPRLVSIGHGMVEVWSNQFRKWVLMDAELNWHYEKDGVPLNMAEIFEENYTCGPTRVRVVRGHQSSDPNTTRVHLGKEEVPLEILIRAHHTRLAIVDLRNDWLTNRYFPGHPARSERNSLVFTDPRLAEPPPFAERLRPQTGRREDLYWTLNQTEVRARAPARDDVLELALSTVTPNFDHFEVVVDGGPPQASAGRIEWRLHAGVNTLAVRSVNQAGVRGIESSAAVRMR
jgi:hypothetical protein